MNNCENIFALSSGHGKAGVAVIRISGTNLTALFERIINKNEHKSRYAYYTNLKDDDGDLIDQCIAVYFNAPRSFTGEDVIEIYSHGAPAVINKIFDFYIYVFWQIVFAIIQYSRRIRRYFNHLISPIIVYFGIVACKRF